MPFPALAAALPEIAGGVIGAIGSIFGGRKSSKSNEAMMRRQEAMQREFAQHGVRWRVEDAKAAGLHPLYALGAQLPSYSPLAIPDSSGPALAEAGQNIGRAVAATQTKSERMMTEFMLRKAAGELEEGDLRRQLLQLEIDRERNAVGGAGNLQTFPVVNEQEALSALQGMTEVTPSQTISRSSSDSSLMAGATPMWREFEIAPGFRMVLPGGAKGDPSEALESVSESLPLLLATLEENDRRYGPEWTDKLVERYLGSEGMQVRRIMQWLRSPDRVKGSRPPLFERMEGVWEDMKKARRSGQQYPR